MTPAQLRAFRKRVRLTQAGLAAALGEPGRPISKRNIEYYERGQKPIPRLFTLACGMLEIEITTYGG